MSDYAEALRLLRDLDERLSKLEETARGLAEEVGLIKALDEIPGPG